MKVIKLELHVLPDDFAGPYFEMLNYPKIQPKLMTDLDTLDYTETSLVTKDLYPLCGLALGSHREWFYIREKDKEAIVNLLDGFVHKAKLDMLEELDRVANNNEKDFPNVIRIMKKGLLTHPSVDKND